MKKHVFNVVTLAALVITCLSAQVALVALGNCFRPANGSPTARRTTPATVWMIAGIDR